MQRQANQIPDEERIRFDQDEGGRIVRRTNAFFDDVKKRVWKILWWPIGIFLIWFALKLLVWLSISL